MEELFKYFAQPQNGILGIIIIMLLMAMGGLIKVILNLVKRLDAETSKHQEELKLLNTAISVLQEKRIADYDKNSGALVGLGKDLLNSDSSIQKTLDRLVNLFELRKITP